MKKETADSVFYLFLAVILPVLLILSVTAVEKPDKSAEDHADDEDGHRRGAALGRRKVGAGLHRVKNRKLVMWQRFGSWVMLFAFFSMVMGAFQSLQLVGRVMDIKAPTLWKRKACLDKGWHVATDPVSQRRMYTGGNFTDKCAAEYAYHGQPWLPGVGTEKKEANPCLHMGGSLADKWSDYRYTKGRIGNMGYNYTIILVGWGIVIAAICVMVFLGYVNLAADLTKNDASGSKGHQTDKDKGPAAFKGEDTFGFSN
jgi:hypothetical protein